MKVIRPHSVDTAIRTLSLEDRQKVLDWFTHLANRENDEHTRQSSKATAFNDVHVLNTPDDLRIFFTLDLQAKAITIVDIAKPSRFKNVPIKAAAE